MKRMRFLFFSAILSILWKIYARWTNFYRWAFEGDLIEKGKEIWDFKIDPTISAARTDLYRGGSRDTTWTTEEPNRFWESLCENLVKYRRDRWYMGFDVCSHPLAILGRGAGDCDDFASLAREVFGWQIIVKRKSYYFSGFITMFWYKPKVGHMVATWTASDGQMLVANGKHLESYISLDAFRREFETAKCFGHPTAKIWCIGEFSGGNGYSMPRFEFSRVLMADGVWWSDR